MMSLAGGCVASVSHIVMPMVEVCAVGLAPLILNLNYGLSFSQRDHFVREILQWSDSSG